MSKFRQDSSEFFELVDKGVGVTQASRLLGIDQSTGRRWLKRRTSSLAPLRSSSRTRQPNPVPVSPRATWRWWAHDDPEIEALQKQAHDHLVARWEANGGRMLVDGYDCAAPRPADDDPRLADILQRSADSVLAELRAELARLGHRPGILS